MIKGLTIERSRLFEVLLKRSGVAHLILIGTPGVGKSYLLNKLAQHLIDSGTEIYFIEADRYSIESIEDFSQKAGLRGT